MSQPPQKPETPEDQTAITTQDQDNTLSHLTQNEVEARALTALADRLQGVIDDWDGPSRKALEETLRDNRLLWGAFYDQIIAERSGENPAHLPPHLSSNVIKLANFVFKRTMQAEGTPAADKLPILITINREIAAGLLYGSHAARP